MFVTSIIIEKEQKEQEEVESLGNELKRLEEAWKKYDTNTAKGKLRPF